MSYGGYAKLSFIRKNTSRNPTDFSLLSLPFTDLGDVTRDRGDGAISPRLEELERDLGATLQLNDEREEEIAKLKEEIVRLQREKDEADDDKANLSLQIKQLQSQISQKDEDFLRAFERNSALTEEVEKEKNAVDEKRIQVEKLGDEQRVAAKLAADRLEGIRK